jgi:hypothetical protein
MRNTADVTDGKTIAVIIAVYLRCKWMGVSMDVAFYDNYGGKREVLFFYFVTDTTRDIP